MEHWVKMGEIIKVESFIKFFSNIPTTKVTGFKFVEMKNLKVSFHRNIW